MYFFFLEGVVYFLFTSNAILIHSFSLVTLYLNFLHHFNLPFLWAQIISKSSLLFFSTFALVVIVSPSASSKAVIFFSSLASSSCYAGFSKDWVQHLLPTSGPATVQVSMSREMLDIIPGSSVATNYSKSKAEGIFIQILLV